MFELISNPWDILETDFPQMVLRMGYGQQVPPTPRRSVREVLSVI